MPDTVDTTQQVLDTKAPAVVALNEVLDDMVDDFSVSSSSSITDSSDSLSELWDRERRCEDDHHGKSKIFKKIEHASDPSRTETTDSSASAENLDNTTKSTDQQIELIIPSHERFSTLIHKHEIPRKLFHSSIGFLTLWLYTKGFQISQITPVLMAGLAVVGGADYLRFKNPQFNKLYVKIMGFMMREKEVHGVNGVVWYLAGLILVFLMFPKDISILAVLLLSWADTAASTIGRAYGRYTPKITKSKSLAGSMSSFAVGVLSTWLLYSYFIPEYSQYNTSQNIMWSPDTSRVSLPVVVLASGFIASVSELVDVCDDNFSIPLLSAAFMWAFIWYNKI